MVNKPHSEKSYSNLVGSVQLLTPEQFREYQKKERKGSQPERGKEEAFLEPNPFGGEDELTTDISGAIRAYILQLIGGILRYILHWNMHSGSSSREDDNLQFVHGLIDFFGGSLGGATQVLVSQPMDTVKVKLQTFPERYKGMVNCLIQTYKNDGIAHGLYAGSLPAVVANVAENSVLFAAYGGCQEFVTYIVCKENTDSLTTLENALAGFIAAFFSSFTLCPTELIKCKFQALREMKEFLEPGMVRIRTPWGLTKYIYKKEGIRGFYRGLGTTFIREMPGLFCFFGGYEGTRELLREPNQSKDDIGAFRTMIAGAVGGITLWTSTFPADVIKSRIQVKNLDTGMLSVGVDIIRSEGYTALYRGLLPTIIRTIPSTATLFVVYEYTKKTLLGTLY